MRSAVVTSIALVAALPTFVRAAETPALPTLAIGASAPDFDLPSVDGRRSQSWLQPTGYNGTYRSRAA